MYHLWKSWHQRGAFRLVFIFAMVCMFWGHLKEKRQLQCVYQRIIVNGRIYHSIEYRTVKGRNSYTVKYMSEHKKSIHHGHVQYYQVQKVSDRNCQGACICSKTVVAFICRLNEVEGLMHGPSLNVKATHIKTCFRTNVVHVVNVLWILGLCVSVVHPGSNEVYVCKMPKCMWMWLNSISLWWYITVRPEHFLQPLKSAVFYTLEFTLV